MKNSGIEKTMGPDVPTLLKDAGIRPLHWEIRTLQGGNNRVYKIIADDDTYVLKEYFVSEKDLRNRLLTEFVFLKYIWEKSVRNVPEPIFCDLSRHMALFRFIEGEKPAIIEKKHIVQSMDFIQAINDSIENGLPTSAEIGMASDFSSSVDEYVDSTNKRIIRLKSMSADGEINREAKIFVAKRLIPRWKKIIAEIRRVKVKVDLLLETDMILSPSDFGFHNSVMKKTGQIYFIDFEYAGWDDPVKMICDFFCQPEIQVPLTYIDYCIERVAAIVQSSRDLPERIRLLIPLFRIKWCCIMLNDFLAVDSARRQFAFFKGERRQKQLNKTIEYFDRYCQ